MAPIDADRVMWVVKRSEVLASEVRSSSADELRSASRALASERADRGVSPEFTARTLAVGRDALSRGGRTDVSRHAVLAAAVMAEGGTIAEVRASGDVAAATGLAAYWFGLADHGVHLVTADDWSSRAQHVSFAPLAGLLGGEAGLLLAETDAAQRRRAYTAPVTVGSYSQFATDYLRDSLRDSAGELTQRGLGVAVVADACAVLIDAASLVSYLSGSPRESPSRRAEAAAALLRRGEDYTVVPSLPGITFGSRAAGQLWPQAAGPADLAAALDTAQEVEVLLLQREGLADGDRRSVRADITTQGLLRDYRVLVGVSDGRPGCADAVARIYGLEYQAATSRPRWNWQRKAVPAPVDLAFERIVDEQRAVFHHDRQQVRDGFDGRLALGSLPSTAVEAWSARGANEISRGLYDLVGGDEYRTADPEVTKLALRHALDRRSAALGDEHMRKLLRHVSLAVLDDQWAAHLGRVRFVQRHGRALKESLGPLAPILNELFVWSQQLTVEHILGYALHAKS
ncbi:hypothetical protein [Micromonospora chokoriensis]